MPRKKLGRNCRLYMNTATFEAPTWRAINRIMDLTFDDDSDEAEMNDRDSEGYDQSVVTFIKLALNFNMFVDPTDPNYIAIRNARYDRDEIDVLCVDGDIDADPTPEGHRFSAQITKFSRGEPLKDKAVREVTLKPGIAFAPIPYPDTGSYTVEV